VASTTSSITSLHAASSSRVGGSSYDRRWSRGGAGSRPRWHAQRSARTARRAPRWWPSCRDRCTSSVRGEIAAGPRARDAHAPLALDQHFRLERGARVMKVAPAVHPDLRPLLTAVVASVSARQASHSSGSNVSIQSANAPVPGRRGQRSPDSQVQGRGQMRRSPRTSPPKVGADWESAGRRSCLVSTAVLRLDACAGQRVQELVSQAGQH